MNTWDTCKLGNILDTMGSDVVEIMASYRVGNPEGLKAALRQAMWLGLLRGFEHSEEKQNEAKKPVRGITTERWSGEAQDNQSAKPR